MYDHEEMKEQGNRAEEKFMEWLKFHKIPFWYIQQNMESFSDGLKDYRTKRPDFMVLVPYVGSIFVDIKKKKPAKKYKKFYLDEEETNKLCNLQNFFNLQVWYVLSNDEFYHYDIWYWIPVSKVLEVGKLYRQKNGDERYYSVKMENFIRVPTSDNLGRVFSEIPKFL